MKNALIVLIIVLLFTGCEQDKTAFEYEQEVYGNILEYLGEGEEKQWVVLLTSVTENRISAISGDNRKEDVEAYQAYKEKNKERKLLPITDSWKKNVKILTDNEYKDIFKYKTLELGWEKYYKKYPKSNGIIGFSRVGFNTNYNEAFVYVEYLCGALCGRGFHARLHLGVLGWEVKVFEQLWVS